MDVAVEQVVADVGGGSFHALDEYFPFGHIEVVVEELTRMLGLPVEIFGNVPPELWRGGIDFKILFTYLGCLVIYSYLSKLLLVN